MKTETMTVEPSVIDGQKIFVLLKSQHLSLESVDELIAALNQVKNEIREKREFKWEGVWAICGAWIDEDGDVAFGEKDDPFCPDPILDRPFAEKLLALMDLAAAGKVR